MTVSPYLSYMYLTYLHRHTPRGAHMEQSMALSAFGSEYRKLGHKARGCILRCVENALIVCADKSAAEAAIDVWALESTLDMWEHRDI